MGKVIIYIHGFNSGPGKKSDDLKKLGHEEIAPQLANKNASDDIEQLCNAIDIELVCNHNYVEIIGTSLGGFYALVLRSMYKHVNFRVHAINPSLEPYNTLNKHLGKEMKNYKTGEKYVLETPFLKSLEKEIKWIKGLTATDKKNTRIYIGTEDEVLTFDGILKMFPNIQYSKQDHRYSDLSDVYKNLRK